MLDSDVRAALHARLRSLHARELGSTRFVDELGVAGEVRIDTAVLNGSFAGYEIKSASDTLRRLPKQVEVYSKVVDYATLVVAENHVSHALGAVPSWWGLVIASTNRSGGVRLRRARQGHRNRRIEPEWLVRLLWKDETLAALETLGAAHGMRGKPLPALHTALVDHLGTDELRTLVRESLKSRTKWRAVTP
ncbi:sce7726 family protein [Agromyces ramosus]|uniref:Sce7726 family protein n=1 Tax=Agromyces ramosus TaxID=33879 RepID=A0ABU0RB50_9MICO|nr:sce7726 family protein [Agromyces ramosus]MDQ0895002.1 hypothetical protein [Agromyces ramosus]